ncbi:hypothetical protein K3495_g11005 [Podosphaera aphanis]|nr:hypothetical protein K3495_g11005 [Podosphaera aphanis]
MEEIRLGRAKNPSQAAPILTVRYKTLREKLDVAEYIPNHGAKGNAAELADVEVMV